MLFTEFYYLPICHIILPLAIFFRNRKHLAPLKVAKAHHFNLVRQNTALHKNSYIKTVSRVHPAPPFLKGLYFPIPGYKDNCSCFLIILSFESPKRGKKGNLCLKLEKCVKFFFAHVPSKGSGNALFTPPLYTQLFSDY